MTYVDIINAIEVVLWPVFGVIVLVRTFKATPDRRRLGLVAGICLVFFGVSDVVELYSKAWWHPWWLLVWKGTCIITLLTCAGIRFRKLR